MLPRRVSLIRWLVLQCAWLSSLAPHAQAHDPPRGTGVFQDGPKLLLRTNRGLVASADGAHDYRLLCNEALGIETYEVPSLLSRPDGRWLIGTSHGLMLASADFCTLEPFAPLATAPIAALVRDPNHAEVVYLTTASDGEVNGLYVSRDAGLSFAAYGDQSHPEQLNQLFVSASDDATFYASGRMPDATSATGYLALFAISSDRGLHFSDGTIALGMNEYGFELLGIELGEPARLLGAVHAYLGTQTPDRLLLSRDSGKSWDSVLMASTFDAFALRPSDHMLWVGSPAGLWRSSDLAGTLTQIQSGSISCLAWVGAQLFVCDGTGPSGGLSISNDDGATLERVMSFVQVASMLACPATSTVTRLCQSAWTDWQHEIMPVESVDAAAADSGGAASEDDAGPDIPAVEMRDATLLPVAGSTGAPDAGSTTPADAGSVEITDAGQTAISMDASSPAAIGQRAQAALAELDASPAVQSEAGSRAPAKPPRAQGCSCNTLANGSSSAPLTAAGGVLGLCLLRLRFRTRRRVAQRVRALPVAQ